MKNKINVLVPMAGRGQRFVDEGYKVPKQLIKLKEKHLIEISLDCIDYTDCNLIFIVRDDHINMFNMGDILKSKFGKDITIVVTDGITEGSVCSCLLARKYINNDNPLIIHTLDVEFAPQFKPSMLSLKENDGIMLTSKSNSSNYSYAAIDEDGFVVKTAEKKVISENACVGIYGFARGYDFCKFADRMVKENIRTNGEFYISPVYNLLIQDGLKIKTQDVEKLHVFGTPDEFNFYRYNVVKKFGEKPIALCCDHSGYDAKEKMKGILSSRGIEYIDYGCFVKKSCDYKDYIQEAVRAISDRTCDFAFSFCRTGQGVNMCANKYKNIRSALIYDEFSAEMATRHNCANFFALPSKLYEDNPTGGPSAMYKVVSICLKNTFDGGRHQARIQELDNAML